MFRERAVGIPLFHEHMEGDTQLLRLSNTKCISFPLPIERVLLLRVTSKPILPEQLLLFATLWLPSPSPSPPRPAQRKRM